MFNYEDLILLTKEAQKEILTQTFNQILDSQKTQPHSLQNIISENREISIAARMSSKPLNFKCYSIIDNKITNTGEEKIYTGKDIANIFIDSLKKYGETFYPITGSITKLIVKHLILFVKSEDKYIPYCQFNIEEAINTSSLSLDQAKSIVDPNPIMNSRYKTLLRINQLKVKNLPTTYLGNTSGEDIYNKAFKGSSPNIVII